MKMTDFFSAQLEREAAATRRALERVPEGRSDWKPHEKSMGLGRLSNLVASMPSWVGMIVDQDELALDPPGGSKYQQPDLRTGAELAAAHDTNVVKARSVLANTTDERLMQPWKLIAGGRTVSEQPRYVVLSETIGHLAHHRGQLTVYLRLLDVPVPSIYGPSADDARW
jgi:uncharacterized damage-inducible protein DinB